MAANSVEEREATAFVGGAGRINLPWSGLSWARPSLPEGNVGPVPTRAAEILKAGDVVYVAQERAGGWRLAQIPDAQAAFVKTLAAALEKEDVAYDIDAYRDAPPGLRIWCGATIEARDVEALTQWLDWAFAKTKDALPKAA